MGAGRPRKIEEEFDRWHIGCLCEHEHRMIERGAAMERIEERPEREKVRAALKRLDQKRRRFVKGAPAWELQKLSTEIDKIGRYFSEPYRRPKGCRAAIIAKIAKQTGHHPRMVTRCWVEYRAMRREIDAAEK
jgi:hypothetical protein